MPLSFPILSKRRYSWGRTPVLRPTSASAQRVLEDPRRPGGLPHTCLSYGILQTLKKVRADQILTATEPARHRAAGP